MKLSGLSILIGAGRPENAPASLNGKGKEKDFVEIFLDHLANWDFTASQLK